MTRLEFRALKNRVPKIMGCCSCRRPVPGETMMDMDALYKSSLSSEEAKLVERQVLETEHFTRDFNKETLEPARQRVANMRRAHRELLARMNNKRFAVRKSLAGGDHVSIARCQLAVTNAERALERAQQMLDERVAEMRSRHQRERLAELANVEHQTPAAAAWSGTSLADAGAATDRCETVSPTKTSPELEAARLELAAAQVVLKNMRRQLEQWRARVAKAQSVLEAKEEEALEELKRGISKARFRVAEAQGVVLEAQAVLAVVDEVPTNEEANEEANEHFYC